MMQTDAMGINQIEERATKIADEITQFVAWLEIPNIEISIDRDKTGEDLFVAYQFWFDGRWIGSERYNPMISEYQITASLFHQAQRWIEDRTMQNIVYKARGVALAMDALDLSRRYTGR